MPVTLNQLTKMLNNQYKGEYLKAEKDFSCNCCRQKERAGDYYFAYQKPKRVVKICLKCVLDCYSQGLSEINESSLLKTYVLELFDGNSKNILTALATCHKNEAFVDTRWYKRTVELTALSCDKLVYFKHLQVIASAENNPDLREVAVLAGYRIGNLLSYEYTPLTRMIWQHKKLSEDILIAKIISFKYYPESERKLILKYINRLKNYPVVEVKNAIDATLHHLGINGVNGLNKSLQIEKKAAEIDELTSVALLNNLADFVSKYQEVNFDKGSVKAVKCKWLAEYSCNTEKVAGFFNSLPEAAKKIIEYLYFRRGKVDCGVLNSNLGFDVAENTGSYYYKEYEIFPEYNGLIEPVDSYHNSGAVLNRPLRLMIADYMSETFSFSLEAVAEQPETEYKLLFDSLFLAYLPSVIAYMNNGSVKLKQNGLPVKASLRQISQIAHFKELYSNYNKIDTIRAEILFFVLYTINVEEIDGIEELIKSVYDFLLKPVDEEQSLYPNYLYPRTFTLKDYFNYFEIGRNTMYCGETMEKELKMFFMHTLESLPDGWVRVDDILKYLVYNNRKFPMIKGVQHCSLKSNILSTYRTIYVSDNVEEYYEKPLIRIFLLFMGALGILELAYDDISNDFCLNSSDIGNEYLTVADGIKAVKLTPLAEWYLRGKEFDFENKNVSCIVTFSEKRLMINVKGDDSVVKYTLEDFAEEAGPGIYVVNENTFFKKCNNEADVEKNIKSLKKLYGKKKIPKIWNDFIETIKTRVNPLKITDYIVYKLSESPELHKLFLTDQILKKNSLKAENGHIIVFRDDVSKVKNRLKKLGFFVNNI